MSYLGTPPGSDIVVNSHEYVATTGQTEFNVIYDKYVEVYLNGVQLSMTDFTATNGISVVLNSGANVGDIVKVNGFESFKYSELSNKVDLTSPNGAAIIPSGTTASRPASPQDGWIRYNTDLSAWEAYNATEVLWLPIGGRASGGGTNEIFYENDQAVTNDYTLISSRNAITAGPITINDGVIVTIEDGASWVIV